ncbi:nuclear transport factor 2 family protein [Amycolatopsis plumensis]|uniref:nuclear transport factor 2 family protein n=1 Tax=Amycolatopsis plumensis TaxID=236508 RepID=UPI00361B9A1E
MPPTVSEVAELVRDGLSALDVTPFAGLFAADAVYEVPFLGERIEGRDAVVATLAAGGVRARSAGLTKAQVTTTLAESGFVVELVVSGPGVEFPSSVGILTVAGGEITSYRDYPDTSAAAKFGSSSSGSERGVKPHSPQTAE